MSDRVDVLIIGAGPIGLSCGIAAEEHGLSHLIIEKGCLVNSLYHYPTNMTFFSTSLNLEIGGVPFVSHGDKPTRREALEYYRRVRRSHELNVRLYEAVETVEQTEGGFRVRTAKGEYGARKVVVATGFYDVPNKLNVPGEDLPKVKHYYDEPHPYAEMNVLVVGAGNSAVDVALETYRKQAKVTLVSRSDGFEPNVKYWVKPDIENRIKHGEITAYFNSTVQEITADSAIINTPDGSLTIPNDFVLAMTGYRPNFDFLRRIGLHIDEDKHLLPRYNEDSHLTNIDGMYLAGVVCGGTDTSRWYIENSRDHGNKIMRHIRQSEMQRAILS